MPVSSRTKSEHGGVKAPPIRFIYDRFLIGLKAADFGASPGLRPEANRPVPFAQPFPTIQSKTTIFLSHSGAGAIILPPHDVAPRNREFTLS